MRYRFYRGLSLLETVIALFILTGALVSFFTLFHSSLGWQKRSESLAVAVLLGQNRMEELRIAAQDVRAFQNGLPGEIGSAPSAVDSSFEIETNIERLDSPDREFCSPNSEYERNYSGVPIPDVHNGLVTDDRKLMTNSMLAAHVTVSSPGRLSRPFTLTAYIREPLRELTQININQIGPSTIAYQERTRFEATALDAEGIEIPDVVFQWRVDPITGYGTIYQSRSGRVGRLEFVDFDLNGTAFQPPAGECQVSVTANVAGVTHTQSSNTIVLTP